MSRQILLATQVVGVGDEGPKRLRKRPYSYSKIREERRSFSSRSLTLNDIPFAWLTFSDQPTPCPFVTKGSRRSSSTASQRSQATSLCPLLCYTAVRGKQEHSPLQSATSPPPSASSPPSWSRRASARRKIAPSSGARPHPATLSRGAT